MKKSTFTLAEKWKSLENEYEEVTDNLKAMLDNLNNITEKFDKCNETLQKAKSLNLASKNDSAAIRQALDMVKMKLNQVSYVDSLLLLYLIRD